MVTKGEALRRTAGGKGTTLTPYSFQNMEAALDLAR